MLALMIMKSVRQLVTTTLQPIWSALNPKSLQFRLTIGVTLVSLCGVGSIAIWTAWKTQRLLIDSHKQLTIEVTSRLPQDVELYAEMMPLELAIQRSIDNRSLPGLMIVLDRPSGMMTPTTADDLFLQRAQSLVQRGDQLTRLDSAIQRVGDRALVLCRGPLRIDGNSLGTLYVAQDITEEQAMFIAIIRSLSLVSLLVMIVMAVALAVYVRRSLLPLKQVGQLTRNVCPDTIGTLKLHLHAAPTEVNELAETCDDMLQRLATTWDQQRQFVNDVSHELRTPLTIVSGYLQSTLRRNATLTEPQREALEIAASEANRTIHLLEELLELARADSGNLHYHLETISVNELLAELCSMVQGAGDRTLKIEAPLDIWVEGDRQRLKQVLMNLIDNALNYSASPQPVIIRVEQHQGQVAIAVQDFGCGIPLQHQSRIFDRFYRVDEARARSTGGCGLGLSLVKTLVDGMGGRVSLASKPHEGSTFTVTLPLASSTL